MKGVLFFKNISLRYFDEPTGSSDQVHQGLASHARGHLSPPLAPLPVTLASRYPTHRTLHPPGLCLYCRLLCSGYSLEAALSGSPGCPQPTVLRTVQSLCLTLSFPQCVSLPCGLQDQQGLWEPWLWPLSQVTQGHKPQAVQVCPNPQSR